MQQVQLYIENERIELFKDESISLTETIQNIKDISKVFTNFTKTFSVPASKTNNKIFKHYYNSDITEGFDARLKKSAVIKLNGIDFKKGKIKLEGVDLKSNKPDTYRITFFGSTVDLKDVLGEDKLGGLEEQLASYNRTYSAADVKDRLQASRSSSDVIVPLITHTQRLYYKTGEHGQGDANLWYESGDGTSHHHGVRWKDLKYAIRINKIIEAIESKYTSLNFRGDFFKNTSKPEFDDLFMWLHRKSGDVENLQEDNTFEHYVGSYNTNSYTGSNYDLDSYTLSLYPADGYLSAEYSARIVDENNVTVFQSDKLTGDHILDLDYQSFQNYTVYVSSEVQVNFDIINVMIVYIDLSDDTSITTNPIDEIDFELTADFEFSIGQQIPDMKVIDFLTGLFKMFNLTAYVDEGDSDDANTYIVVKPLNEYYETYDTYDITEYIDVDKQTVDVALPYKEISFTYKDTKTFLANRYNQIQNKAWAESIYSGDNPDLYGSLYKVEVPFSHMMFERLNDDDDDSLTTIQYGWSAGENMDSYKGDPLLFYPYLLPITGNEISYIDNLNNDGEFISHTEVDTINIPSNSLTLNPVSSEKNINFENEYNEYTRGIGFEETLFQEYYKEYIVGVFNPKNRITKLTAYLPFRILLNFTLADRFIVAGKKYKINSITTNLQTGKSDMELLNDI